MKTIELAHYCEQCKKEFTLPDCGNFIYDSHCEICGKKGMTYFSGSCCAVTFQKSGSNEPFISDDFRYLQDGEVITEDCLCFGSLENGSIGWGKPPQYLIGETYCEGYGRHPDLIAKLKEKK